MKNSNPSRAPGKRGRDIDFLSVPRGWGDAQPQIMAQHDPQRGRGVHDPRIPDMPRPRQTDMYGPQTDRDLYEPRIPHDMPELRIRETLPPARDLRDPRMKEEQDPRLTEVLGIIRGAIRKEAQKAAFYDRLTARAPTDEDKRIIQKIRDVEQKHLDLFRQLYQDLTGEALPYEPGVTLRQQDFTYCGGLRQGLMDQQEAVETYREILFALDDREHIDMMTEIITDELRHLGLYNYLFARNRCTE